ncbi:hypothetical protein [Rhodococcoides kroppenstedtii]|uniref:hypothetical protein n=1 Tax=Rhodococcoides kroppenstedtii TaxID=293050 RepID=UPI0028E3152C|nr:hypothetical protein [Rhodococcus kroppenstedtii]
MYESVPSESSSTALSSVPSPPFRVLVSWWVIGDGSFPRASVGDDVEVFAELITGTSSRLNHSVTAFAVPAYGMAPRESRDGRRRWWHLLYGERWSAGWWSDAPRSGRVAVEGYFVASLGYDADGPVAVRGRVSDLQSVQVRLDPMEGGGRRQVAGTESLTEVDEVPVEFESFSFPNDGLAHRGVTGVLVDLELGDPPTDRPSFDPGAIDAGAGVVWVMHRSDPTVLRIDSRQDPPVVREFLLPLPIEEPSGDFTRRVHATDNGCWIVGMHDVHRVVVDGEDVVAVERVCVGGGIPSVVVDGQVYVFGSTSDRLMEDRRHGMIRRPADAAALWVCDPATQSWREVTDRQTVFEVRRQGRRPDMVADADGVQWMSGRRGVLRRSGDETTVVDLGGAVTDTAVWVQPRPEDDPATAALMARITVDASKFVRVKDDKVTSTGPVEESVESERGERS